MDILTSFVVYEGKWLHSVFILFSCHFFEPTYVIDLSRLYVCTVKTGDKV